MRDLSDLCVKILHYEFQDLSHLCFVYPAEPIHEVVDGCALRKVAEKGRNGQSGVLEHPGPAHFAGNALDRWTLAPVRHAFTSLFMKSSSAGDF